MNKNVVGFYIAVMGFIAIVIVGTVILRSKSSNEKTLNAMVLNTDSKYLTVMAEDNKIYKLLYSDVDVKAGDMLAIKYTGILDSLNSYQTVEVVDLIKKDEKSSLLNYEEKGIFSQYYKLAQTKLNSLSLDEKIGQLLLARYDDNALENISKYNPSGFVFYSKDFADKTKDEVKDMIINLQKASKIPLLTAVDEEGGSVVRVSSNKNLRDEPFKSSKELYDEGGFAKITEDTKEKSKLLASLGLNLNLAPVVDVSTSEDDYIYPRAFGYDEDLTSEYAKTVIEASKGLGVSYTLKHFPTQATENDPHSSQPVDNSSLDDINNKYLLPFKAGIDAGAESVLISHNVVNNLDDTAPASLSVTVHNLLRNDLNFTGIIITDDLDMKALEDVDDTEIKALIAGNNLIITTDYASSFQNIKTAVEEDTLSEDLIDNLTLNVIAWKYYKNLISENIK